MEQIIDIVGKYPVRNQTVIYMTLHYAVVELPILVLRDFLPFDNDLYNLVEILRIKGSDEQITPVVELLGKDFKLLLKSFMGTVTDFDSHGTSCLDEETMLSFPFCLYVMLGNILREFHTMKQRTSMLCSMI